MALYVILYQRAQYREGTQSMSMLTLVIVVVVLLLLVTMIYLKNTLRSYFGGIFSSVTINLKFFFYFTFWHKTRLNPIDFSGEKKTSLSIYVYMYFFSLQGGYPITYIHMFIYVRRCVIETFFLPINTLIFYQKQPNQH